MGGGCKFGMSWHDFAQGDVTARRGGRTALLHGLVARCSPSHARPCTCPPLQLRRRATKLNQRYEEAKAEAAAAAGAAALPR